MEEKIIRPGLGNFAFNSRWLKFLFDEEVIILHFFLLQAKNKYKKKITSFVLGFTKIAIFTPCRPQFLRLRVPAIKLIPTGGLPLRCPPPGIFGRGEVFAGRSKGTGPPRDELPLMTFARHPAQL